MTDTASATTIEQLSAEVRRLSDEKANAVRRANDKETELNNYRKQVAEKAIDIYDDGDGPWCKDGYVEAMEELGLSEFVKVAYTIEVTLTIPAENIPDHLDRNNISHGEVAEILKNASGSDLYYWVDDLDTNDDE